MVRGSPTIGGGSGSYQHQHHINRTRTVFLLLLGISSCPTTHGRCEVSSKQSDRGVGLSCIVISFLFEVKVMTDLNMMVVIV